MHVCAPRQLVRKCLVNPRRDRAAVSRRRSLLPGRLPLDDAHEAQLRLAVHDGVHVHVRGELRGQLVDESAQQVDDTSRHVGGVHGLAHEGEDIRVHVVSADTLFEWLDSGRIDNAMAIIAVQWFRLNRASVRSRWLSSTEMEAGD